MTETHHTRNVVYFVARYLLQRKYLVARAPAYGVRLRFRIEDAIGRWIYKRGSFEAELTDYITGHIAFGDGSVFLDIGANIGWYSLTVARRAGPKVSIIAFEPDPLSYRLLTENIRLNGCGNVRAVETAVSDSEGTKTLYLYANKNRGRHSLLPINDEGTVEVRTTSLDAFLAREGVDPRRVAFAKIDVEGYEYPVLNGARRLLDTVPVVLCEFSPGYMRQGGMDPRSLVALLREKSYLPHALSGGELRRVPFEELDGVAANDVNYFWVKQARPAVA